jgi:hypothetical protein
MTAELRSALAPVADALESLGVVYRVGGSVASSVFGVGRSTLDIDLVAAMGLQHVEPLAERLSADYYVDGDMIRDAIRRTSSFNVIHLATMMKVDVFIVKSRPFDRVAFARVTTAPLDANERSFPLTTAEDIVLHKLEWFLLGGGMSERQWHDVLGVLQVQAANLDRAYLDRWATDLGVADLLARAFREAEPR